MFVRVVPFLYSTIIESSTNVQKLPLLIVLFQKGLTTVSNEVLDTVHVWINTS